MSTSIHAVIEYQDKVSDRIVWSLGEIHMGVSFSNIFALLGAKYHNYKRTVVPKRGLPVGSEPTFDMSWEALSVFTMLVDPDASERQTESDGTTITVAEAETYIASHLSVTLPKSIDTGYYYITDPDIHSANWITADELEKAIVANGDVGYMYSYKAALAAMRSLEADKDIKWVRLVYGFDN